MAVVYGRLPCSVVILCPITSISTLCFVSTLYLTLCVCVQMQENMYEEGTDVSVTVGGALHECNVACLLYDCNDAASFDVAKSMMVCVCVYSL